MIVAFGIDSLRHVGLIYRNWWKGTVFGPFAIVIGFVFVAFAFKLGSLESEMKKQSRKSEKRIRHRF